MEKKALELRGMVGKLGKRNLKYLGWAKKVKTKPQSCGMLGKINSLKGVSVIQQREKIAVRASEVRNAEGVGSEIQWDMSPYKCLSDPYGTRVVEGPCGNDAHPGERDEKGKVGRSGVLNASKSSKRGNKRKCKEEQRGLEKVKVSKDEKEDSGKWSWRMGKWFFGLGMLITMVGSLVGGNFPKIESLIDEWCEVLERKQGNEFGYRYPYCGARKSHTLGKGLFAKKETYSTYTWENLL